MTKRYVGLTAGNGDLVVQVKDTTLVVRPDIASSQLEKDRAASTSAASEPNSGIETESKTDAENIHPPEDNVTHAKTRFFEYKELNADLYAVDLKKIADEVLAHLRADGVALSVRIEVEATSVAGFDEAKVRTVSENAKTLKFDQSGFEEA